MHSETRRDLWKHAKVSTLSIKTHTFILNSFSDYSGKYFAVIHSVRTQNFTKLTFFTT